MSNASRLGGEIKKDITTNFAFRRIVVKLITVVETHENVSAESATVGRRII